MRLVAAVFLMQCTLQELNQPIDLRLFGKGLHRSGWASIYIVAYNICGSEMRLGSAYSKCPGVQGRWGIISH